MDIHLETRGSARSTGYRFLGAGPDERWWRERYGERTAFEYPTVLVERDHGGWRAYLSGIPSSRTDPGGSTNRVALALGAPAGPTDGGTDGGGEVTEEERDLAVRMIAAWAHDIALERAPGELQQALDRVFPEETVSRLYAEAAPGEVQALVRKAAASLPPVLPDTAHPVASHPSWIAPVRSAEARTAFVDRVRTLLAGPDDGVAVLVNLVDDAESYALDAAEPGTAALVTDPDGRMPAALAPLTPKKAWAPQPSTPRAGRLRRAPRWIAVIALAAVAVVAAIVWGLATSGGPAPQGTGPSPSPTRAPGS